jgi:hypothetical protein
MRTLTPAEVQRLESAAATAAAEIEKAYRKALATLLAVAFEVGEAPAPKPPKRSKRRIAS